MEFLLKNSIIPNCHCEALSLPFLREIGQRVAVAISTYKQGTIPCLRQREFYVIGFPMPVGELRLTVYRWI